MSKIKIFALGGQDERGKNCIMTQVDNSIFLFNSGIKVPVHETLGINMMAPDFSIFKKEQKQIKGLFIGYPTFENLAGLSYLLLEIKTPIVLYTSEIGKSIIKTYFEKKVKQLKSKLPEIKIVKPLEEIKFSKDVSITPFKVSCSIPDALGWVLNTPDGAIVHVDDFIVNNDKTLAFNSHMNSLPSLVKKNTLALISPVGNAGIHKGFTTPNHSNKSFYEGMIKANKGRTIVACNSNDIYSIITLANVAKKLQRPFIIHSNTFINVFQILIKNKLFNTKGLNSLPVSEIDKSENAIVVMAENQDQLFQKMFYYAENKIETIKPKETDLLIMGIEIIPGYESMNAKLLDLVSKLDIENAVLPKTIMSLKASDEDQKFLINLLKPKNIFATQCLYKNWVNYNEVIKKAKYVKKDTIFLGNGEGFEIINGEIKEKRYTVSLEEKTINRSGSEDTGGSIIYERKQMANNGIALLTFAISKKDQKFVNDIKFKYFGIIHESEKTNLAIAEIEDEFIKMMPKLIVMDKNKINLKETKINFRKQFAKMFEKKLNKRPIVLPSVLELK